MPSVHEDKNTLQALLRELRISKGYRQTELAEKLGKPQSYVSKYEAGEKSLNIYELKEICSALNTKLSAFVQKLEDQ